MLVICHDTLDDFRARWSKYDEYYFPGDPGHPDSRNGADSPQDAPTHERCEMSWPSLAAAEPGGQRIRPTIGDQAIGKVFGLGHSTCQHYGEHG